MALFFCLGSFFVFVTMYDMPIILTLRPCKDVVESLGNSRSRGLGGAARLDTDACLIARLRHLAGRALGHGTLGNLWACIFNCGEPRRQQLSQSRATVVWAKFGGRPKCESTAKYEPDVGLERIQCTHCMCQSTLGL